MGSGGKFFEGTMRFLRSRISSTTFLRAAVCAASDAAVEGGFAWREEWALDFERLRVRSGWEEGRLDVSGEVGFGEGTDGDSIVGSGLGLAIIVAPVKECCRGGVCAEIKECDAAGTATGAGTGVEVGLLAFAAKDWFECGGGEGF